MLPKSPRVGVPIQRLQQAANRPTHRLGFAATLIPWKTNPRGRANHLRLDVRLLNIRDLSDVAGSRAISVGGPGPLKSGRCRTEVLEHRRVIVLVDHT
eukprot:7378631-Lingulodinium_polyedra.AAC.1